MAIAVPQFLGAPLWAPAPVDPRIVIPSAEEEERLAARWYARHDERLVRLCRWLADVVERRHHPVTVEGTEHLPEGPALLVGNHGHLGYETLLFFAAVLKHTGLMPRGLADRWFFRVPVLRDVLVRVGGAYGHPTNARRLLEEGHWVVCYPGGAREALKRRSADCYRLQWDKAQGFARVALEMGVPIVPFAAAGVDHTFDVVGTYKGTGRFLMGHDKYDLPRLAGPTSRLVPRAVPFLFRFGKPIYPPHGEHDSETLVHTLHQKVWSGTQELLDRTLRTWLRRHGANVEHLGGNR